MAAEIQDIEDEIDVEGFDEKEGSTSLLPDETTLPPKRRKNDTGNTRARIWREFGSPVCDWSVDDMDPESRLTIEKMLHEERRYLRTGNGPVAKRPKKKSSPYLRWTPQERQQFEQGFMSYGNRWTQIARLIPTRSALQVKNYARYYFPTKLKLASDKGADDAPDLDGVKRDGIHPHLPESLNAGSPTIATRPHASHTAVAAAARGIPTPSRRRHFRKFGFANLSPSRVLKSRSGKDALASMKRIAEGRSAARKLAAGLESGLEGGAAAGPARKTPRPKRGRACRARVRARDDAGPGLTGYPRDGGGSGSGEATGGGGSVDLFEQGGGVVRMRPESSEDEDVDVEEDAAGEGDKHQENLLMGLAVACDRLYNNLITPAGKSPANANGGAGDAGARPQLKARPGAPDRSMLRGPTKVNVESLCIPELPWNADHTYSMSLRTLHKLGVLRGSLNAEGSAESSGRGDAAFRAVAGSKVVTLTREDAEDIIGDAEAFSPESERVHSPVDLPQDGDVSVEFKTEPVGVPTEARDAVGDMEPTECHIPDGHCHEEDTACHVPEEPIHMEDAACHAREDPCHAKEDLCHAEEDPCHAMEDPCHAKEDPCHAKEDPCHAKEDPCHVRAEACHTKEELCPAANDACHIKDEPCHIKDEPYHVQVGACHASEETCHNSEELRDQPCDSHALVPDETYLLIDTVRPVEPLSPRGQEVKAPLCANPEVQPADSPVRRPAVGSLQERDPEGCTTAEGSTTVPRPATTPAAPLELSLGDPETHVGSDCETAGSNQEEENRGDAQDEMTSNAVEGEADSDSGGNSEQTAGSLGGYRLHPEEIEDWEKQALPEFFEGRPAKTPERYLKIRNYIHQQWLQIKPKYLNKAAVRQGLKSCGDVNSIGRIHRSLENAGIINYGVANPHRSIIDCRVNALRQRRATKASEYRPSRESKRPRKKKTAHPESEPGQRSEEKPLQRKSVRSGHRKSKSVAYDPFKLIECCKFTEEKEAPFHVRIQSDAMVIMDVHSHMSSTEVIGLLGGKFGKEDNVLDVLLAVPCNSISTGMQCEMDPVSQTEAYESILAKGYQVVGWYHSHPAFAANPSVRDIETQSGFQGWFSQGGAPFIGIIVSPCHNYQISQSKVCCLTISAEWSPELKCRKPYQFDFTISHSHCDDTHTMGTVASVVTKFSVYQHRSEMLYLWSRHYDISFLEKMLLSIKTYMCPVRQSDLLAQIKDFITAEFTAKTTPAIMDEDHS